MTSDHEGKDIVEPLPHQLQEVREKEIPILVNIHCIRAVRYSKKKIHTFSNILTSFNCLFPILA